MEGFSRLGVVRHPWPVMTSKRRNGWAWLTPKNAHFSVVRHSKATRGHEDIAIAVLRVWSVLDRGPM